MSISNSSPEGDFVGVIKGVHGRGCGLAGLRGNREGALADLRNKASVQHVDVLVIQSELPPHSANGCLHDAFVVEARGYRLRRAKAPTESAGTGPRSVPAALAPGGEPALVARTVQPPAPSAVSAMQTPSPTPEAPVAPSTPLPTAVSFSLEELGPVAVPAITEEKGVSECRQEAGFSSYVGANSSKVSIFVLDAGGQLVRVEGVPGEDCILHGMDAPGCVRTKAPPPALVHFGSTKLVRYSPRAGTTYELGYDQVGRLARVATHRPGQRVDKPFTDYQYFRYHSDGRTAATAFDGLGDGTLEQVGVWESENDEQGRLAQLTLPANAAGDGGRDAVLRVRYDYGPTGRLAHMTRTVQAPGGSVIVKSVTDYSYDAAGRLRQFKRCRDASCLDSVVSYRSDGTLEGVDTTATQQGRHQDADTFARYGSSCLLEVLPPDPTRVFPLPNELLDQNEMEIGAPLMRVSAVKGALASRKPSE